MYFLCLGVVSALSYKTKIDTEDCVALLPTGYSIFSMHNVIFCGYFIPY